MLPGLSWLIALALQASAVAPPGGPRAAPPDAPRAATRGEPAGPAASAEKRAAVTASPAPSPAAEHRLVWRYPRFQLWQYVASGAISGLNVTIEAYGSPYPDSRVRGAPAVDVITRNALRISSRGERHRVARISDYLWHGTQYFGVAESLVIPLVFDRGNFDVAWQLTMINWQVVGLAFLGTRLTHLTVSRVRPSEIGCSTEPGAARPCKSAGPSFLSGHVSMSAAGAASTCMHHHALKLLGGGWPDTAVCVALASTTVGVGVMRIAVDKHWMTDVVAGFALGSAVGVGVPYFFHYAHGRLAPLGGGLLPRNVALFPSFDTDGFGLSLAGWL